MNRTISIILGLLLLSLTCFAKPVSLERAKSVAKTFLQTQTATRAADDIVHLWSPRQAETRSVLTQSELYVFGMKDAKGFVIVSGDDAVYPILGYSETGTFEQENIPPHVLYWLEEYQQQIKWAQENNVMPSQEIIHQWSNIDDIKKHSNEVYLPTANWDQGAPYNNQCPEINGKRSVTGCVATALAILMKYHRWPDVGEGQASYSTATHKKYVYAVFNKTYNWDSMPDEYISGLYTADQAAAVAMLMQHCGVLSQMDYSPTSSGAFSRVGLRGMKEHMKYDVSANEQYRAWYSQEEWDDMIRTEIDNNRPVVYGGQSESGGHQFIVHGYNADGFFNLNWGWSGAYNGLFLLSALTPSGQGTGGSGSGYNSNQSAMFNLEKAKEGSSYRDVIGFFKGESGGMTYAGITNMSETIEKGVPFQVRFGFAGNYGTRTFNGVLAFALVDAQENIKEFVSQDMEIDDLPELNGTGASLNLIITQDFVAGDRIRLFYKSNDSDNWFWVRGGPDTTTELLLNEYITSINNPTIAPKETLTLVNNDGVVTIIASAQITHIALYTADGNLMKQMYLEAGRTEETILINDLPKGVYVIKAMTKQGMEQGKIIK